MHRNVWDELLTHAHGNLYVPYSPRTMVSKQLLIILLASLWVFSVVPGRKNLLAIFSSWLLAPLLSPGEIRVSLQSTWRSPKARPSIKINKKEAQLCCCQL